MNEPLVITTEWIKVPCSADVLLWNYWDGEHLEPIHGGYASAKLLYMGANFSLFTFRAKPPFLPFSIPTISLTVQHKQYLQFTYALQLFLLSKTEIRIKPETEYSCLVRVTYSWIIPAYIPFIRSFLRRAVSKWFANVYQEDLPLRVRRQRVINAGFSDYEGMPVHNHGQIDASSSKRHNLSYHFKQPLKPAPGSPLLDHPFFSSV